MSEKHYNLNLDTEGLGKPFCDVHYRSIRNKALDAIFGKKKRILIIAPSECVKIVSFTAVGEDEKGGRDEK